ncbi:MAG: flagellar hook assembly protein FlgD [Gammaproteobacteria bacterium]|nr:flagellar hook assembly protein FlgD [Gammaproteobacteria bacterium]
MELIDPLTRQLAVPAAEGSGNRTELGQSEFLRLMVTQFRNQDPLKPMENGEFLGQLAQFSTVSGIGDMNNSIATLASSIRANQALQAAAIVGREVLVEGNNALLGEEGAISGAVELPSSTARARVRVVDASGGVVREIALGQRRAGLANFSWDGMRSDGTRAPAGEYRIEAQVLDGEEVFGLATLVASRVVGVSLDAGGGGTQITTELGETISLASVRSIR